MPSRLGNLLLLSALYFVEGLPFGLQSKVLPVYLRTEGVSLTLISLSGALALPWLLKLAWAPFVERFYLPAWGRRRSWIVPMLVGIVAASLALSRTTPSDSLAGVMAIVFVLNLFAATLDIAVDGLAVDTLKPADLGIGNSAQVAGYKVGMLTTGGLLLWATERLGWSTIFVIISGLVGAVLLLSLLFREPPMQSPASDAAPPTLVEILRTLARAARVRGAGTALLLIATYKLGESLMDAMLKPFLVDVGLSAAQIGLWVGTYGMAFSIAGSVVGGMVASRFRIIHALAFFSIVRLVPMVLQLVLVLNGVNAGAPSAITVIAITGAEHFFGGGLTTAMFAFMMKIVDRRIGATHFTALATLEAQGKTPAFLAAGPIADGFGYGPTFMLGLALAVGFAVLVSHPRTIRAVSTAEAGDAA